MIIDYHPKYNEEIKDLLVELQEHIIKIDKEGYHIIGEDFREKYFAKTMEEVNQKDGRIYLYKDDEKIVGLIIGIINNEKEVTYDFKAPKRGRITELIVKDTYRGKHIGKELLNCMKDYLKSQGCEKTMISVFGYNDEAISFYEKNGFHIRMVDMIED